MDLTKKLRSWKLTVNQQIYKELTVLTGAETSNYKDTERESCKCYCIINKRILKNNILNHFQMILSLFHLNQNLRAKEKFCKKIFCE